MKQEIKRLQYKTKANDVDEEKGIVTVAVNGIGVKDSQDDISMPGSFNKTLSENIGRMRWFLNHRTDQLLGVPIEGKEEGGNLIMTGQLNLAKQMCRDILADYKLFAENGRTLEHSIGVQAIKRDKEDARKVLEWKMYEYSTLTHWGSNPQTFLVGIKSATPDQIREQCDLIRKAFLQHGYTDERLKAYDMELNLLLKSLNGGVIVTCPCCGHQFDYESQPERTFSQQVLDLAAQYQRWITEDIVREEMEKLAPEIREQVEAVLDIVIPKNGKPEFEIKSLTDIMTYVRCPHCYSRVYKSNTIIQEESTSPSSAASPEPSVDTQKDDEQSSQEEGVKEKAAESTLPDFAKLNEVFNH
jgi:HK97 family phage prohead protease